MTRIVSIPAFLAAIAVASGVAAQTFTLIEPPAGYAAGRVQGLSHNGLTAVGFSIPPVEAPRKAFRWSASGGREDYIGPDFPLWSFAYAVSSDGSTAVGQQAPNSSFSSSAFRRVGQGVLELIGPQAGYVGATALATSSDGSTVVGFSKAAGSGLTREQAFRWTPSTGLEPLGYLDGPTNADGFQSQALGVSADGNTVVGWSSFDSTVHEGFVWSQGIGMQRLPPPPGYSVVGPAVAVSPDGRFILADGVRYDNLVPQLLGTIPGYQFFTPRSMSADGQVAVGFAQGLSPLPNAPWVWTQGGGMALLSDYLTSHGVSIPSGWQLYDCYAVSGDGRSFGGMVISPDSTSGRGFIATVPTPATIAFLSGTLLYTRRRRR